MAPHVLAASVTVVTSRVHPGGALLLLQDNYISLKHEGDKMIVFDLGTSAGPLVFVVNLHPSKSFTGYRIGVPASGE
jgi:hypothetical protein